MFSVRCHALLRRLLAPHKTKKQNADGSLIIAGFSSASVNINYYDTLGIPRNSTQTDIKAAYYRLSKQYHPDKNQGCVESANKFREITRAYEVLGNYRLRRLYDKGAIHSFDPSVGDVTEESFEEEPDDPQTKFYKSRFTKSKVADARGRTPIYNFDEWSRAHYGDTFQRRKQAKEKWDQKKARDATHILDAQNEYLLFGGVIVAVGIYVLLQKKEDYDSPNKKKPTKENTEGTKDT